jgi:hypothetical protein
MVTAGHGALAARGWLRFDAEPATLAWAGVALMRARQALAGSGREGWRCGGTWWVGLDALDNDAAGAVDGMPLAGHAADLARSLGGGAAMHRGQLSTTLPGFPRPDEGESPAAFAFRRDRAGAHVDGLLAVGPHKRRILREPHGYVLGIALSEADPDAAPLTVWDASHIPLGEAFRAALRPHDPGAWTDIDLTEPYKAARRDVLARCKRLALPLRPGEAVVLHRHLLHGVAPWAQGAGSAPEGRIIAYFRPEVRDIGQWAES